MDEKEISVSGNSTGTSADTDSPPPPPPPLQQPPSVVPQVMTMAVNMSMERTLGATPTPATVPGAGATTTTTTAGGAYTGTTTGSGTYGSSGDLLARKKRGRPRKYDAEGNLVPTYRSPPAMASGFSRSGTTEFSLKRGRGKHASSGNWQVLSSLGELFANTAGGDFTAHIVTVNTGEDVAGKILSFAQTGSRGVCVLSANGAVSNVTIRQPGSSGGILTYEGRFEILSLSGSYTITDTGGVRSRSGGLSVSLAGPDGRVIGGGLAGMLMAASPIQIVLGSFLQSSYKVQKRKYNRAQPPAITGVPESIPAAMPQAKPDNVIFSNSSISPLTQEDGESDEIIRETQVPPDTMPFHIAGWNDSRHSSDQRPSPDINVSVGDD